MTSEDEQVASDAFDMPNSIDTHIFAFDSDQSKLSPGSNNLCDHYLREHIGEPLSQALTYAIIYRPEDPIEFISDFLIDWSRRTTRQKLIDHESKVSCSIHKDEEHANKHLLKEGKEEKAFESDEHLSSSSQQEDSSLNRSRPESSGYFQEPTLRITTREFLHTHDTASGFDDHHNLDQMKSNRTHPCQNGNLSHMTYFSQLRDKIIKCDES